MAYAEAIPAVASIASRVLGSTVGRMAAKTVATKAVGAAANGIADNVHPISNSGPTPASQPMAQPGYNNLSQAQFADSVQQQ